LTGYIIYWVLRGFSLLINLLPEGFSLRAGRWLGRMMFCLDRGHRKVALENLHLAFGKEKSGEELDAIARRTFENLGMMAVEFFRIPKLDVETFKKRVKIEGLEEALELLSRKKGMLLLLSHFGNWEMMGIMSKLIGDSIMVIAKPMKKNKRVDEFITRIRNSTGLEVVSSIKSSRTVMKAVSRNRVVGILIDQRAKRSEGIWADFFGKEAPTTPALAVLAMKTGAPVVPVFMVRNGFNQHRMVIQEPLTLVHTGDVKKDVEANTQRFNHALESMIRQYPDQWFWVHRRWERKKRASQR
jgi:KDO2-lipid IV(A) lauroyltransferase